LVKIPSDTKNIADYFNAKLNCLANTNSSNVINIFNDKIIKMNDIFEVAKNNNSLFNVEKTKSDFYPVFIKELKNANQGDLINSKNLIVDAESGECALCQIPHQLGFSKDAPIEKIIMGKSLPATDDTNLIYKNFIVTFNQDPYMPNHLMLMTLNHDNNKLKGSQYEILNKEILDDVLTIFSQVNEEYIMGHNYALSGSQKHFHIHMMRIQPDVNYGLNRCVDYIADVSHADMDTKIRALTPPITNINFKGTLNNTIKSPTDKINLTWFANNNNPKIKIIQFEHELYGYKGYSITIKKADYTNAKNKQYFTNVVFNFLNYIEKSIEYTFNIYFPSSTTNLSVVVYVQPRFTKKNVGGKSTWDLDVTSFRNISDFVFTKKNLTQAIYDATVTASKTYINKHVVLDVISDDDLFEILKDKPSVEGSIYGDINLRQVIELPIYLKKIK